MPIEVQQDARRDIAAALAALSTSGFDVGLDAAPGPGWLRLDRYARDPGVLDEALRLAGRRFGRPEPSPDSGGWLVADVAAAVAWPAVAALLAADAVIVTAATDIHLPHPSSGQRLTARVRPPVDLAGPASSRARSRAGRARRLDPGAADTFAAGIAEALEPLLDAVHRRTKRGRHALAGTVTDMVAAAFHRVGDEFDPLNGRAFATRIIDGSEKLSGGANWNDIVWRGGTERTRVRNICCLWYRTPDGALCLTCPRIGDDQRRAMLERRASSAEG